MEPTINLRTWQEAFIKSKHGQHLYCRYYYAGNTAANILYIQTPLTSVSGMLQNVYEPLVGYGYNVFAIDFSGVGKSPEAERGFSAKLPPPKYTGKNARMEDEFYHKLQTYVHRCPIGSHRTVMHTIVSSHSADVV